MVSLVDIVPQKRTVQISGGALELRGLGLRQIAELLLRFPSLRNLFVPGAPDLDIETVLIMAPDAVGAIIAEAAGQPEAVGAVADVLGPEEVLDCLVTIRDLTMPNGVNPFLERLAPIIAIGLAVLYGRDRDTSSPPVPNGSLPQDTIPAT